MALFWFIGASAVNPKAVKTKIIYLRLMRKLRKQKYSLWEHNICMYQARMMWGKRPKLPANYKAYTYSYHLLLQEFNPIWFLPPDSYLAQWHQYNAKFFPSSGEKVKREGPISYARKPLYFHCLENSNILVFLLFLWVLNPIPGQQTLNLHYCYLHTFLIIHTFVYEFIHLYIFIILFKNALFTYTCPFLKMDFLEIKNSIKMYECPFVH